MPFCFCCLDKRHWKSPVSPFFLWLSGKVLIDFLNRRAFENWTTRTEADLRGQVVKFLDSVMGPNKLIERFKVMKIEQDPNQKDRVLLDIHITPYFPAKSFVIQLAGHKGDNPEDAIWESEYHQE